MSDVYPLSMHCRFTDFPSRIRVICGRAFEAARATPFSFGSRVTLSQTPKSGQIQGQLVPGQPLPALEVVYADTGDDDAFDLKLAHYGYGRFYLPAPGATAYALAVIKGVRVEAAGIHRCFETVDVWDTLIPAGRDLSEPGAVPDTILVQDCDNAHQASVAWYRGDKPAGAIVVSGRLQLGGNAYIAI